MPRRRLRAPQSDNLLARTREDDARVRAFRFGNISPVAASALISSGESSGELRLSIERLADEICAATPLGIKVEMGGTNFEVAAVSDFAAGRSLRVLLAGGHPIQASERFESMPDEHLHHFIRWHQKLIDELSREVARGSLAEIRKPARELFSILQLDPPRAPEPQFSTRGQESHATMARITSIITSILNSSGGKFLSAKTTTNWIETFYKLRNEFAHLQELWAETALEELIEQNLRRATDLVGEAHSALVSSVNHREGVRNHFDYGFNAVLANLQGKKIIRECAAAMLALYPAFNTPRAEHRAWENPSLADHIEDLRQSTEIAAENHAYYDAARSWIVDAVHHGANVLGNTATCTPMSFKARGGEYTVAWRGGNFTYHRGKVVFLGPRNRGDTEPRETDNIQLIHDSPLIARKLALEVGGVPHTKRTPLSIGG